MDELVSKADELPDEAASRLSAGLGVCEECDSGISESELMDRLKEALDQRDAYRAGLERLFDHAAEVRGYADGWEWKYGQAWDEEMNIARNLLDGCQAGS